MDLALNNQQRLICHKTLTNQTIQLLLRRKPTNAAASCGPIKTWEPSIFQRAIYFYNDLPLLKMLNIFILLHVLSISYLMHVYLAPLHELLQYRRI